MVKIDLITGFLGSGKTTFLVQYAKYLISKGLKIGILEYDYGAVNVDMLLLNRIRGPRCELEMVAAACDEDCLKRRFTTKLIAMAMSGYDRVIVEPSGIFDMDMFFDALRDEPLERMYEIGTVISIVNANMSDELSKEEEYFLASQAAGAGTVIFSRTQLVSNEKLDKTRTHLLKTLDAIGCNNFTGRFETKDWKDFDDTDYERITSGGYRISDYMKLYSGHNNVFSSVCFLGLKDNLEQINKKIDYLFENMEFGNVIRVKGFVCDGGVGHQINASRYECLIDKIAIGEGVLIVIGENLCEEKIRQFINK